MSFKKRRGAKPALKEALWTPILFLLPYTLVFLAFTAYPTLYSLVLSFMRFKGGQLDFVGLKNFTGLFSDPLFFKALKNSFTFLVLQVPIQTALAVLLAVFLNLPRLRGKGLLRAVIFMPILIDAVSYSIVFRLFFGTENGLVNNLLLALGMGRMDWMNSAALAKSVIVMAVVWRWAGYNMVIILGGMQSIGKELYEAASIDGAGKLGQFWHVTLPGIKPVLVFSVVLSVNGTLQMFTESFLLTSGGPVNETMTIVQYLYQTGFQSFNFGMASAGAYVLAAIIAVFTLLQLKLTKGE